MSTLLMMMDTLHYTTLVCEGTGKLQNCWLKLKRTKMHGMLLHETVAPLTTLSKMLVGHM